MANPEHLKELHKGYFHWNKWIEKNRYPDLSYCHLSYLNLNYYDFRTANLQGANLQNASLESTTFGLRPFSSDHEYKIKDSNPHTQSAQEFKAELDKGEKHDKMHREFRTPYYRPANLSGANLSGANLKSSYIEEVNFSGANLSGANLSWSYIKYANFSGANLSGANLENSYIEYANFSGANFSGANLKYSYIVGANFTGAKNLTVEQVRSSSSYWPTVKIHKATFDPELYEQLYPKPPAKPRFDDYTTDILAFIILVVISVIIALTGQWILLILYYFGSYLVFHVIRGLLNLI
jgi:uncharacterized protein YjbI with pentapeptide repeats